MNALTKTAFFALPLALAASMASAGNFEMTIANKIGDPFEIDKVAAAIGNMRCTDDKGNFLGKNADFTIPGHTAYTCSISHTHGAFDVQFNVSNVNNILQSVRVQASGHESSGTLIVFPPVNPVTDVDGHTLNLTGEFVN